jgi:hypothetical protein
MHDRGDPGGGQGFEPVGKREKGIGGRDRATDPVAAALDCQPRGVDPVDLSHADADGGTVGGDHDRIGLDRAAGRASATETDEIAMPHGLACLIIATHVSSWSKAARQAASASVKLL